MVNQTQPLEHTCGWDCLTSLTLLSPDLIFCLFKAKAHACTMKVAKDRLSATLPLPIGVSWAL
jgi:hypothetical protein